MSLGKLLATGRSLASGPAIGRYNVKEQNRLPKFGSAKNPFAQPAGKAAVDPAPAPAAPAPAVVAQPVNTPFAREQWKKTQRIPGMAAFGWKQRAMLTKNFIVAWTRRLASLAMAGFGKLVLGAKNLPGRVKRVRREEPPSVIPRFGKPAVQAELSLDNVKVVRNDLEESDLEIVTAQTDTSTQVAPTVAPATANRGPVPPALKKLTNRMPGVKLG